MMGALLDDADDPMGSNARFMAVENDIANGDGAGFDGCNRDIITITYGRIHAVAGSAELYSMTFSKQFRTNFFKVIKTEWCGLRTAD